MSDAIKRLEPYEGAMTRLGLRANAIKRSRKQLERQLNERRDIIIEAHELGAPRADIATIAGVSPMRVSQIIAGGAR